MDKIYSWFKSHKNKKIYVLKEDFPSSIVQNIVLNDENGIKIVNIDLEDSSQLHISKEKLIAKEMCGFNSFEMIANVQSENGDTIHVVLDTEGELIFTTSEDIGEDWGEYLFSKRPPKMIPYESKSDTGWPMRLMLESDDYVAVASVTGNEKIKEIINEISSNGAINVVMLYRHKKYSMTRSENSQASLSCAYHMYPESETFVIVPEDEAPSIVFNNEDITIEVPYHNMYYIKGVEDECLIFDESYPLMIMKAIFENPDSCKKFVETGLYSDVLPYEKENESFKEKFNKKYFVEQMFDRKIKIPGFYEDEYLMKKTKAKVEDFLFCISFLRKNNGDKWLKENCPELSELKDLF